MWFVLFFGMKLWMISKAWSSLVEGGEGSYLPNCQTNLVIALYKLSLFFCKFINTTAYHLGRSKHSSPIRCHSPRLRMRKLILNWITFLQLRIRTHRTRGVCLDDPLGDPGALLRGRLPPQEDQAQGRPHHGLGGRLDPLQHSEVLRAEDGRHIWPAVQRHREYF